MMIFVNEVECGVIHGFRKKPSSRDPLMNWLHFTGSFFLGLTRTPAAPLQNRALANGQNGHGGWRQKERAFSSKRMR